MKKIEAFIVIIVLLTVALGLYLYPTMPEQMATHWNINGEVDGYSSKFWGLFLMPLILCVSGIIFILIPRIDPLKDNIEKFRKFYEAFIIVFILFLILVHMHLILWNTGARINPMRILPVGIGVLFFFIGILLKNAKQNWFIGIRTPWTMSSEKVWDNTHKLGAKLFQISGILAIISAFTPSRFSFFFMIIPVISSALFLVIYSFFQYSKEMKSKNI